MTICIAALCDDGRSAILAADRMMTVGYPMEYQFEREDFDKIHRVGENQFAMFSGDVITGTSIINDVQGTIYEKRVSSILGVAEIAKQLFIQKRLSVFEQYSLVPRGITLQEYYNQQHTLNSDFVQAIDHALMNFNIGLSLILVGQNGQRHSIYAVSDPGVAICFDAIGYHAIGSGSPHAMYAFLSEGYSTRLSRKDAHEKVLKIKGISERAPGVGRKTTKLTLPIEENQDDETEKRHDAH